MYNSDVILTIIIDFWNIEDLQKLKYMYISMKSKFSEKVFLRSQVLVKMKKYLFRLHVTFDKFDSTLMVSRWRRTTDFQGQIMILNSVRHL